MACRRRFHESAQATEMLSVESEEVSTHNTYLERSTLVASSVTDPLQGDSDRLQSSPWHVSRVHLRFAHTVHPTKAFAVIFSTPSHPQSWSHKNIW